MKLQTILKAGSLALDIYKHDATQELGGLIRGGLHRRKHLFAQDGARAPTPAKGGKTAPPGASRSGNGDADPWTPIRHALKHVTPENAEKALQWHGIIRSFLSKE